MIKPVPDSVLDQLKAALGEGGWSTDPDLLAPKLVEWRDRWRGSTPLLALPRTTEQVSDVVRICAAAGVAITPQGGNTGLVGGQIPQGEILLSLERMRAIRALDVFDDVIEVEAGATLASVQQAAHDAGRFFPVSLASEGTASIGGLISTNAGGVGVLRYGTMRAQVLGLEAVLPNGEIWNGLRRLRKDNTGYDLKQLLIAAEGTLGVITAAALKLYPIMASRAVAFVGLRTPQDAVALLARAKGETGGGLEAFELISALGLGLVCRNIPDQRLPLTGEHAWTVLLEAASSEAGAAEAAVERLLAKALEDDLIQDAAVAQTEAQAHAFWALRENQSAAQKPEGPCWKHDIAAPVSRIPEFLERAAAAMEAVEPGARIAAFGHVGDGNIHYDVLGAPGVSPEAHAALRDEAARRVYDIVADLDGSISAEHGLGIMKAEEALKLKPPAEIEALRAIRQALDPKRIMNPRVLF